MSEDEQQTPEPDPLVEQAKSIAARLYEPGTPEHEEAWPVELGRLLERQEALTELQSRYKASGRYSF